MILDTLDNLAQYASLNPHFPDVIAFLEEHPIETLPVGKTVISDHCFVNVTDAPAKTREEALVETHRQMVDIQIPITGEEEHGFDRRSRMPEAPYNAEQDISFHPGRCNNQIALRPGEFVIYFPQDAHAPAITPTGLRKAIVKVEVQ